MHQFANNVRPLPTYAVRATDEVNGKVFLLIRINEGGAPPYRPMNDPTVYLWTGNITTRVSLESADAEVVRELYAKRANAEGVREANVARAKTVVLSPWRPPGRDTRARPRWSAHRQRVLVRGPEDVAAVAVDDGSRDVARLRAAQV